ncbi:hypothetical protein HKBW3S43_00033 [Candidatus Hakubella thermalkaliphila]|uniref:Glycosyltransferase 2-like domain-containing protein n=1 Tax=Candidatus Hakubella thermalkaliphila TaxID=2754717 RepID=A0A6V8PNN5_9ACTN|nr:glycosyltransferase family 2 protein [Candidatus Hakubella thermalkaliphila]GFP24621.1 hypothetical protein HKBW3S25_00059 [Candidatus Hakubella thermalkaliphila]GFP27339.1 hypothetical protein HKBW3S33_00752 [Candidatus Hakubella thermalkaliphila]GFP34242.1 hypothetical protein HKBW3S43_00033 [Candidatus Hakubella thermalkaliphila]
MNKKICVLLPAYNEAQNIQKLIQEIRTIVQDIVVIDDGSRDETARLARRAGAVVISHKRNQGKGVALKTGFNYALGKGYHGVITMDADGQHLPGEIKNFLLCVETDDPDIILGSRMHDPKDMPPHRLWTNLFTSWLISRRAGQKIEDCQSGFRCISSRVLEKTELVTRTFDTEPELLMRASWHGFKIHHVPITSVYLPNSISRINPIVDTWRFFALVFRSFRWKRNIRRAKNIPADYP